MKFQADNEGSSALPAEAKEVAMDEIVKEIRTVKRQNLITHGLLSALIVVTAVWQFKEASLLLSMKEMVTHPIKSVGNMIADFLELKKKKPVIEAHPLPPISVPELPRMDPALPVYEWQ